MVAEFKSHVLRREEKGLFGIPFKRLLAAGMVGVLAFMLARFAVPNVALFLAALAFLASLILSAQRGGLSLYTRLLYRLRGWLIIQAAQRPRSNFTQIVEVFNLPAHLVLLDGAELFAPPEQLPSLDFAQWETYAAPDEMGQGLIFLEEV